MPLIHRLIAVFTLMTTFLATPLLAHDSGLDHEIHKVAIQVSDNEPGTMNKVLNVAANMARAFGEAGDLYEIEIVAYNAGLHLLRTDTSPVAERIANFPSSVPNLTFTACGNTMKGMTRKEGAAPPLFEFAQHVPAGVMRLMELSDQGYFVIRP